MTEEQVSHEELDAAIEAAEVPAAEETSEEVIDDQEKEAEEVVEETPAQEEVPEEPEDNNERSMLGRKVKSLGDSNAALQREIADLKQTIVQSAQAKTDTDDDDDDDEVITSKSEIIRVAKQARAEARAEEQKEKSAYVQNAELALVNLGLDDELDEAVHVKIYQIAEKKWVNHTGDAAIDAKLNYAEASKEYYRGLVQKDKEPANPLDKNKDETPEKLGGGSEGKKDVKKATPIKLEPEAEEFVKASGMKPEEVEEALTGDAPTYLSGGIR